MAFRASFISFPRLAKLIIERFFGIILLPISFYNSHTKLYGNDLISIYHNFEPKKLRLKEVTPKHIQDYYQYSLEVEKVSANTVIHRHANIRKALQYAMKTELIDKNPADLIERPRKDKFVGSIYDAAELDILFGIVKGLRLELAVILGAFYGLRRSEVVGLKWDAIDFNRKTIAIKHTITEVTIDGKTIIVEKDRTKTKSSYRSLPLVKPFEELLLKLKAEQAENRKVCGKMYCKDYLEYIYVNELGERIRPNFITQNFSIALNNNKLKKIRFHDLRHSCASLLYANGVSLKVELSRKPHTRMTGKRC